MISKIFNAILDRTYVWLPITLQIAVIVFFYKQMGIAMGILCIINIIIVSFICIALVLSENEFSQYNIKYKGIYDDSNAYIKDLLEEIEQYKKNTKEIK